MNVKYFCHTLFWMSYSIQMSWWMWAEVKFLHCLSTLTATLWVFLAIMRLTFYIITIAANVDPLLPSWYKRIRFYHLSYLKTAFRQILLIKWQYSFSGAEGVCSDWWVIFPCPLPVNLLIYIHLIYELSLNKALHSTLEKYWNPLCDASHV